MATLLRPPDAAPPVGDAEVIDLTGGRAPRPAPAPRTPADRRGVLAVDGLRIRRVRLRSVATTAAVFAALGWVTVVGTAVALWNAALAVGVVDTVEESVTTALGLDERLSLVGADLFPAVLWGSFLLMLAGWVLTLLLALVYNVASATFGGVAVETGPLCHRTPARPAPPATEG